MNSLFHAGLEIQNYIEAQKWRFCFIGGLAVLRWGELRMTQDIDLSLFSGFGYEESFIKKILSAFPSRISDALNFALSNRVLLLSASNHVPIDISLSGLPFEKEMINRATPFQFHPDCFLITCSAEDLIILKAFANRAIDWHDVEGIVIRQSGNLDNKYIIDQLIPLCEVKEMPDIVEKVKKLLS